MRFQRSLALLGVAFLWWALGPWVPLVLLVALVVPYTRRWIWWWLDPTWKVAGIWAATVLALVGLVVLVPDGWLPIPPGPGAWVTQGYVGRPAVAQPVRMTLPQHPGLAPAGQSSMHDDPWASDAYAWAGPLGESPEVDTSWFGLEECATLAVDGEGRLVGLCGDLHGPTLHVIDPDSMRPVATKDLPDRSAAGSDTASWKPWEDLCAGAYFYLDDRDQAVVATTDRHVLVVSTHDSEGDPDLTTQASYDLTSVVPRSDCLLALMPDWDGTIWWVTQDGRVGTIDPGSGDTTVLDLDEEVANSIAVDAGGGVYVVTTEATYRITRGRTGPPRVTWRTAYDRGSEEKSGQLSQGSGTTPTLLPGGLLAITDNADPRMHVVFLRREDGAEVCRAAVFGDDESATENSLVSVGGGGVVVENNHGYDGPLSTVLGRTTDAGLARVDVVGSTCRVAWTADVAAPSSVAKVSLANGLLYAYTKEHSWWLADAWYVSAFDVRTGRRVFAVRTGTGLLRNNHYAAITITPDSSLYVATLGGLVRVRDRGVG
ncbi:hypothetical protein H5V45_13105 [Nocardioides sp. KIGAM211]|uniref:Uncharacterized protein n=1 Tax=Nocardioides luti TaxID=2761101 RepID=A0A7X0VBC4_9ACTN|nr:hypothetical protein [Nocardioides luti]MBB6628260.1 hypothetical protein [Nocardioides luti]